MGITFQSTIEKGLQSFENKSEAAIRTYLDTAAIKMSDYAKTHAKWTDRTGRARTSLNAHVEPKVGGYRIVLAHGVDYGIWLELAHEKRFAVLDETIREVGTNQVVPGFNKLLERLSV